MKEREGKGERSIGGEIITDGEEEGNTKGEEGRKKKKGREGERNKGGRKNLKDGRREKKENGG